MNDKLAKILPILKALGLGLPGLLLIGYGIYKGYIKKPEPTTTQHNQAEAIVYHYHTPKSTFGCATVRVEEYYRDKRVPDNSVVGH